MMTNDMINAENAERDGIILNKDKKNIIISAGAGAGKTEMLSMSILTRLFSDTSLEPSQVVAITFTNAATEELKNRLHTKYDDLCANAAKEGRSIRKIKIDDIFVSTIHSFCSSLVTQMSFDCELGISPEFEEKTDLSDSREAQTFIRDYIRAHSEYDTLKEYFGYGTYTGITKKFLNIAENPELEIIIESDAAEPDVSTRKCLDPIRNSLDRISDFSSESEAAKTLKKAVSDGLESKNGLSAVIGLIKKYFTPKAKQLSDELYGIVQNANRLLKDKRIDKDNIKDNEALCLNLLEDTVEKLTAIARKPVSRELSCFIKSDYTKILTAAEKLDEVFNEKKGRIVKLKSLALTNIMKFCSENEGSVYPYVNSKSIDNTYETTVEDERFFAAFSDIFEKLCYSDVSAFNKASEDYYNKLRAEFIKGMYGEFIQLEKTAINSNDLLVLSKKLLYGSRQKAVREYFRSKYKVFYIDEFQDTDYLQLKMILALAGDDEKGGLSEGKLFLVGDPKQSIYRFRGAEVAFYNYMKDEFFKTDEYHDLRLNYRSEKSVVDWINTAYSSLFNNGSISYSDMLPVKDFSDKMSAHDDNSIMQPLTDVNGWLPCGIFEEEVPGLSASKVAERVTSLLGKEITVVNKNKEIVRKKVMPEDIMIITNRKIEATEIYEALKMRNIPAAVSGKISPAEKRSMRRLKALLRYVESGTKLRTAEAAAAFSPLSGFRPDGSTRRSGVITDSYTVEQAQKLFELLKTSEEIYYSNGAMAVIHNALNKGYLLDRYMTDATLTDEMPLLYQFIETMSVECYDNISAVNEYIDEFMKKELKNVLSQSKNVRCIRVMNVHQTKGLEANIVINVLYDSESKSSSVMYEYYEKNEDTGKIEVYDVPKCYLIMSKEKKDINKKLNKEELLRKNYVRDTRAEYIMLFMQEIETTPTFEPKEKADAQTSQSAPCIFEAVSCDRSLADFESCYMSASPSSLENPLQRDNITAVSTAAKITSGEESNDFGGKKSAAIRGTVMHRAFELYLLNRKIHSDITDKQLECIAKQAVIESMDKIEAAGAAQNEIEALYSGILNDGRMFRDWFTKSPYADCDVAVETPFLMMIDKTSLKGSEADICTLIEENRKSDMTKAPKNIPAEKIFFTGFSDLICIDRQGRFTVIDYKSDEPGYFEETMLKIYRPQQLAYHLAFSSILKQYSPKSREQLLYTPHAFPDKLCIKGNL